MIKDRPEAFDDNFSSSVSLSKILDVFFIENEDHSIILEFLKQHDEFFKEIISNSIYWTRIFQLDFILECNHKEISYIISKLKSIPGKHAAYCCWQILNSNSGCSNSIKYEFRKEMAWILDRFSTSHPYSSYMSRSEAEYDKLIANSFQKRIAIDELANKFNMMNADDFKDYMSNLNASLFKYRILQYDLFEHLAPERKWIFISSIKDLANEKFEYFTLQVLDSNEDNEIKDMLLDSVCECWCYDKGDTYGDCIDASSFGEMMLNMTIAGGINQRKLILMLIECKKWKRLKEWKDFNIEEFNDILNIGDLVEYKMKKMNNERKKKK